MNVLILGGTSGIGLALAGYYLRQGARVAVCGRDLGRLAGQAQAAGMLSYQLDIADRQAVAAAVDDFCANGAALDLLIVTAGHYADSAALASDPSLGVQMLRTNVVGLNVAFDVAVQRMAGQRSGQLVAVASIAGLLRDGPDASFYSTNKRTVLVLCDTWRKALAPLGIPVTVLVPGYIDTARLRALNHGDASGKPFLLSEDQAVEKMVAAIAGRVQRVVFPWQLHWLVRVFNLLPGVLRRVRKQ